MKINKDDDDYDYAVDKHPGGGSRARRRRLAGLRRHRNRQNRRRRLAGPARIKQGCSVPLAKTGADLDFVWFVFFCFRCLEHTLNKAAVAALRTWHSRCFLVASSDRPRQELMLICFL